MKLEMVLEAHGTDEDKLHNFALALFDVFKNPPEGIVVIPGGTRYRVVDEKKDLN
jgi:hypothetical protein